MAMTVQRHYRATQKLKRVAIAATVWTGSSAVAFGAFALLAWTSPSSGLTALSLWRGTAVVGTLLFLARCALDYPRCDQQDDICPESGSGREGHLCAKWLLGVLAFGCCVVLCLLAVEPTMTTAKLQQAPILANVSVAALSNLTAPAASLKSLSKKQSEQQQQQQQKPQPLSFFFNDGFVDVDRAVTMDLCAPTGRLERVRLFPTELGTSEGAVAMGQGQRKGRAKAVCPAEQFQISLAPVFRSESEAKSLNGTVIAWARNLRWARETGKDILDSHCEVATRQAIDQSQPSSSSSSSLTEGLPHVAPTPSYLGGSKLAVAAISASARRLWSAAASASWSVFPQFLEKGGNSDGDDDDDADTETGAGTERTPPRRKREEIVMTDAVSMVRNGGDRQRRQELRSKHVGEAAGRGIWTRRLTDRDYITPGTESKNNLVNLREIELQEKAAGEPFQKPRSEERLLLDASDASDAIDGGDGVVGNGEDRASSGGLCGIDVAAIAWANDSEVAVLEAKWLKRVQKKVLQLHPELNLLQENLPVLLFQDPNDAGRAPAMAACAAVFLAISAVLTCCPPVLEFAIAHFCGPDGMEEDELGRPLRATGWDPSLSSAEESAGQWQHLRNRVITAQAQAQAQAATGASPLRRAAWRLPSGGGTSGEGDEGLGGRGSDLRATGREVFVSGAGGGRGSYLRPNFSRSAEANATPEGVELAQGTQAPGPVAEDLSESESDEETAEATALQGEDGQTGVEARTDAAREAGEGDCVICYSNPRDTLLAPCGHVAVCGRCARRLRRRGERCPICRGTIDRSYRVYNP